MPEIEQVSKEVSSKKRFMSHWQLPEHWISIIQTAAFIVTFDYWRASLRGEGGQSDVWLVGRSKTKVTFLLPLTLTDKRLVRAGRGCDCWGLPYCGKVVRTGLAILHCLVAAQVESQQATSPGQDLTAPCWLCQNWFLIIVLWQFLKQESIKLHS